MRFKRAIGLAGILLVAGTIPAFADPISAAIVTALALTGTAAVVATVVIDIAIAIALSAAASLLNGGRKGGVDEAANPFAINSTLQSGGTVSRAWGFGFYSTAGSEAYPARTWGQSGKTPNAYFTRFIAISDIPVQALSAIIVDDQRCTYGDGSPDANLGFAIPEYNLAGTDHLWVKFYDGTQTDADAWAVSQFSGDPDYPYGTDQVGTGIAYVIVTALIEQTLFSSFPQYKFELQGAKLYDPRADDTVGGDGDQRWSDASTWAYTENPTVVKYNVLRGISLDGQWLYGLQGTSAGRLPLDSWFAAMNAGDATIETEPDVDESQYRCGGEVVVSSQPADLLDELNKCDNGRIAEAGGIFKTRSGAVGSSVMTFSDADLIVTEAKSFDPFPGLETTINGIAATYPDPNQNWAMTDAPALYSSILEADDGGRRLVTDIAYNFVPHQSQVQRLMLSSREEARKFRRHTVIAPPFAFALEALDVIAWNSDENGYSGKLFTVVPTDQDNLDQGLALVEVDPADYDWDPSTDYRTYTPVSIVTRAPASQVMTGWSVSGETIIGDDSRAKAGIRFDWGTVEITDVNGVLYQVRLASDSTLVLAGETDHFSEGTLVVSQNLSSGTDYEARGKYRPASANRETDWSSWLSVTTPDVRISGIDIEDASIEAIKFASGIQPVQVVSNLSFADATEGATAVLTSDGKLYRYHSGSWTASVPTLDLTGTITAGQIAANAVDITKFASGITPVEIVGTLPTTGNFDGRQVFLTTDKKLYRYSSTASAFIKTVDGNDLVANSVVAGKIAAGAISATQIAAGAITAAKMFVGSTDNLILDGDVQDINYWTATVTTASLSLGFGGSWQSNGRLSWGASAAAGIYSGKVNVIAGDSYFFQCRVGTDNSTDRNLAAIWWDAAGSVISTPVISAETVSGGPAGLSGSAVAPANAVYASLYVYTSGGAAGNMYLAGPVIRHMASASLIVDGAIVASKIGAGEVVAGKLAANAVTAGTIAANAVTAGKIDTDAVTAGTVAAGAINATAIIATDVVVTGHLVANAITSPSVATGSPHAISSGGSYDTLASIAKALSGTGDVLVQFTDYLTWSVNGPRGFYRIIDDASNVILSNGYGGGSCPDFITSTGSGLDTNGRSGSVTYYLQANWSAGASQPTSQAPWLVVTELKK